VAGDPIRRVTLLSSEMGVLFNHLTKRRCGLKRLGESRKLHLSDKQLQISDTEDTVAQHSG